MTLPTEQQLFDAMDATWPAAQFIRQSPWMLRQGLGGGQRVSAATLEGPFDDGAIDSAVAAMRKWGQAPIFQIRPGDDALDKALAARGYALRDPVYFYVGHTASLAELYPTQATVFGTWPPLALQKELWAEGGIGQGRLDVMARAKGGKAAFLARRGQSPAGVAFAALHGDIAMVHAIEVRPNQRKRNIGSNIMSAVADWAQDMGARYLALLVTKENFAANALYARMNMTVVSEYHYRRLTE